MNIPFFCFNFLCPSLRILEIMTFSHLTHTSLQIPEDSRKFVREQPSKFSHCHSGFLSFIGAMLKIPPTIHYLVHIIAYTVKAHVSAARTQISV